MRVVRIHAAAAEEAAEAAARYGSERPGLGAEIEHAIEAALDLLEQASIVGSGRDGSGNCPYMAVCMALLRVPGAQF